MDQMVRNLMDWYGFSMDAILLLARDNPAQVVGNFAGDLAVGNLANLVNWCSEDGALRISETSIGPWTIRGD
jgi:N-acetylglucosamine-6-phosphate deacetylase